MKWRIIKGGALDPYSIHSIYEAIAESVSSSESPNTLHICWPNSPYVCVGAHQVTEFEVNIDKCRELNLPIVRRQIGGGATYLDPNQFFYHIIVKKSDAPLNKQELFRKFLQPTICTYKKFGLNAKFRPLNDVVVGGKKVSGNGAGTFGGAIVVVGNVILDFDPDKFVSVLRIPSEKMRDKLVKSIDQWVSSLCRELGYKPSMEEVERRYIECFADVFGVEFIESCLSEKEKKLMDMLRRKYMGDLWTYKYRYQHREMLRRIGAEDRIVKIMAGRYIVQLVEKPEKLIRIILETKDGRVEDIIITGDFFLDSPNIPELIQKSILGRPLKQILEYEPKDLLEYVDEDIAESEEVIKFARQILDILAKLRDRKELFETVKE